MGGDKFEEQMKDLARRYEQDGYVVVENFLSDDEVQSMRDETRKLMKDAASQEKLQVFGVEYNKKSRYFLDSGDQIRYFYEKDAVDLETLQLQLPVEQSLAKIAHALHCLNPVFKSITTNERVKQVYKAIGFVEPTVAQSMLIFKNPKVGGAYMAHQDAEYLYVEPVHLAGLWFAMDDALPDNGCLEFIPGSHKWPLARRYMRTGNMQDGEELVDWTAPLAEYDESKFVKVPVRRGDMLLIHGLVVHRSAANNSDKPRWIYTFHAYDKNRSKYCPENWLQESVNKTFMPIYSN